MKILPSRADGIGSTEARVAIIRTVASPAALLLLIAAAVRPGYSQSNPDLDKFFRQNVELSQDQIEALRNGQPVAKTLPPRTPDEVLLFGAVYIHVAPEAFFQFARNFDRLREVPGFLALGVFTDPPQLSDLRGFVLDNDDIQSLKNCEPGNCRIQMPTSSIEELRRSIDWSAADANDQVNRRLQETAFQRLLAYQREGNQALGFYNDKRDPTAVPEQFAYLLSYDNAIPERMPDLYQYLLTYPHGKPSHFEETFYWMKVKFGLKPMLRIEHMVTMRGNPADHVACAVAKKQLYSSHYFETAIDLSVCVRGDEGPNQPGFYLIKALGPSRLV